MSPPRLMMPPRIAVSIIIPAINEAENLPELLRRVDAVMAGRVYEALIVDDGSTDNTPAVCAQLAEQYPLHLHVRERPLAGLSGAVLYGMERAAGDVFVVMDADLQHPPEKLPELIAAVEIGDADFAIGSRYVPGGSTAGRWGPLRRANSRIATLLARPFAGRTHDPMSGFFALRRETYQQAGRLTPLGYKIGLELMCKCRVGAVREVPIHFDTRTHGKSKLTVTQQFKYLEHLSRLYDFCFPRLSPAIKFTIATACAWLAGFGAYGAMLWRDVAPTLALPSSYLIAILATAVFHLRYVRTQKEFLISPRPWVDFTAISLAEFIACTLSGLWIVRRMSPAFAGELFVVSFTVATVVRYVVRKELLQDIRGLRRESDRQASHIQTRASAKSSKRQAA